MRLRIALGAAGVLFGLFGVFRLLVEVPNSDLYELVIWLIAALVLHDGILSPVVVGVGATIERVVPKRARRFLQPALVVGGLITVIALPMIYREGTLPASKAILRQNYGGNLSIALGIVAAVAVLAYVAQVARDRGASASRPSPGPGAQADGAQRPSATNDRPADHHDSPTE